MNSAETNRVVVAVEQGEDLEKITEFTIDLLRDSNAEVYVVQFSDDSGDSSRSKSEKGAGECRQGGDHGIYSVVEKLNSNRINAEGFVEQAEGNLSMSIVEFAEENGAQLLIMDTYHTRPLDRLLHGGTTEKVIRNSSVPVAVVPRRCA